MMTCAERITELVECARGEASPDREMRAHLARCSACRERWNAERQLTAQLNVMRFAVADVQPSARLRVDLAHEFSKMHRRNAPRWAWPLAAAATILLAIFIGHEAGLRARRHAAPAARARAAGAVLYEVSDDASMLSADDFIEVPYTPPLAPGEMVKMVHTEMYPEALASFGIQVDPAWTDNVPVDLVEGEDGVPRAVRITDNSTY